MPDLSFNQKDLSIKKNMRLYLKFLLLFLGLTLITDAYARPIVVSLQKELAKATYVGLVVIKGYKGRQILFTPVNNPKKKLSASSVIKMKKEYLGRKGSFYSTSWPHVNDTVLIAIDSTNNVSLFAKKCDGNYRFWSPKPFTSIFEYKSPAICLSKEKQNGSELRCWDGCLLPINELENYIKVSKENY